MKRDETSSSVNDDDPERRTSMTEMTRCIKFQRVTFGSDVIPVSRLTTSSRIAGHAKADISHEIYRAFILSRNLFGKRRGKRLTELRSDREEKNSYAFHDILPSASRKLSLYDASGVYYTCLLHAHIRARLKHRE